MSDDKARIAVRSSSTRRASCAGAREIEHERDVAIFDLLEDNHFGLVDRFRRPLPRGAVAAREQHRDHAGGVRDGASGEPVEVVLSTRPLRRVVKDYFMICDSYFQAIKGATPSRIEAIDMARRGLHNEGSELLREALEGRVELDHNTARRLFTLVCVLHIRG